MKKTFIFVALVILLCNLAVAGYAAQGEMTIPDVTVKPGDMIYLTVKLADTLDSDTVGVYVSYDAALLEMVDTSCTWAKKGVLQDFDAKRNAGVWTDSKAQSLNGNLCTLAFRVVAEEKEFSTTVSCTVILKKQSEETGRFSEDVNVTVRCNHEYGDWTDIGSNGHSQVCILCGDDQIQSHQWGAGVAEEDPNRPGVLVTTYTCSVCQGVQIIEEVAGTQPDIQETQPTKPNPAPDGTQGGENIVEPDNSRPEAPVLPSGTNPSDTGNPNTNADGNSIVLYAVLACVVVLAATAVVVYFYKKKHK